MTKGIFAVLPVLGALAWAGSAQAGTTYFALNGSGVSVSGTLTIGADPYADTNKPGIFGTPANLKTVSSGNPRFTYQGLVDPANALAVTGVTGTFSDAAAGITDQTITGLITTDPQAHHNADYTIPYSFGWYPGLPDGPTVSYDNLFYPGSGAPVTCLGVPPGGYFDDYGVMFELQNGDIVDMFSNGVAPTDAIYGVVVYTANGPNYDNFDGLVLTVPEPSTWAMMLLGFAGLGFAGYRTSRKTVRAAA